MNYFNKLPDDFTLDDIKSHMLLKSNLPDFNHNEKCNNQKCNDVNVPMMFSQNTQNTQNNEIERKQKTRHQTPNNEYFYPREKDSLFWCYYINKTGIDTYLDNKRKNFTIEHDFKIKTIDKIANLKETLKINKIKRTVVEDQLMTSQKIGMTTLKLFMMLDNTNTIVFKKNCYHQIIFDMDKTEMRIDNYKVVFCDDTNYYIKKQITDDELNMMISKRYKIENFDKPLKAVSSYKVDELHEICKQLNITTINPDSGKNKTKQAIYIEIMELLVK